MPYQIKLQLGTDSHSFLELKVTNSFLFIVRQIKFSQIMEIVI